MMSAKINTYEYHIILTYVIRSLPLFLSLFRHYYLSLSLFVCLFICSFFTLYSFVL